MTMADMQALFAALNVFSGAPDKASLDQANTWLQDFQHSTEAWSTCNVLLLSPDAPPAAKLFAAQTFRTKVIYDLHQVDPSDFPSLRDTLLTALQQYHAGPRTIIIQLCLAVAGLALQFPAWTDAVSTMIEAFGRDPAMVPTLLQFLTILPNELANSRIPVTDEEWHERAPALLRVNSTRVLELLTMYVGATGVSPAVQNQVFHCLGSWLEANEIKVSELAESALFSYMFDALASDVLFDAAVDAICDLIRETQEIDDNMSVIQLIVPRLIALRPQLVKDSSDADKIKGYARIFSEAGETYRMLILQHTEVFFPLVEAIGECSAYPDLDIVPITFPFWMRLAQNLSRKSNVPELLVGAYRSLMTVIVRHLHFPPDTTPLIGQEAEDFRSFRHVMGDTLKDCCLVLRTDHCILATYELVTVALSRPGIVSWQEVEAPLFALRSMGAEVDLKDNNAVPKIMDLIPRLPEHPRVRYAALLIISRYSEWINLHPEYISFQLQYISAGFESPDSEVSAAAGQALKYLCQDCKRHLVEFLPTLHSFLQTTGSKLIQDDRRQVYEAIAYVISAMPMERAGESLKTFAVDIISQVHAVTLKAATKAELQDVSDGLENLEAMLYVIKSFGEVLPAACVTSCEEAWAVFNVFVAKYGGDHALAERSTRVLRHGITLFGSTALPVVPAATARMSFAFEASGLPCYLWIAGKLISQFGLEEDPTVRGSFQEVYERSTNKMMTMLQTQQPGDIPDVFEDYLHLLIPLSEEAPDIFYRSSAFPAALRSSMGALTVIHTDIQLAALELFRTVITHDSLEQNPSPPPNFPVYAAAIHTAIEKDGYEILGCLLAGLIGDFQEAAVSNTVSIFRSLCFHWTASILGWLPAVLQQLPTASVTSTVKSKFLTDVTTAVNSRQYDKVKYAILDLHRASRMSRQRRMDRERTPLEG
ncbi:armadillo-type protein [Mycena floridula]|nr:armadillo-type protein [Mycena floridula]